MTTASPSPPLPGDSPPVTRGEVADRSIVEGAGRISVALDTRSFIVLTGTILGALALWAILRHAPATLTKVSVGVLLALALDPVVRGTQRRLRCSRGVATFVIGTFLTLAFALVVVLLGPAAVREAGGVTRELPATVEETYTWPLIGDALREADAAGTVDGWLDELPARVDDEAIARVADMLVGSAQTLVIVLVTALAVMLDGEALVARARRVVPRARRERADLVGRVVYRTLGNYFAGSLLIASLNALFVLTVGLLLGVPLAPLAAVWALCTNLIPQIGGLLGGGFFVLLALTDGAATGGAAAVCFFGYQNVENNVIQPAVIGGAVNLSPPTTMLAAMVGGAALGVPGALAATPLLGSAKVLWQHIHNGVPAEHLLEDRPDPLLRRLLRLLRRRRASTHLGGGAPTTPTAPTPTP